MDFGKLLNVAKRNTSVVEQNAEKRYYSTKYAPPKKESKDKKLSENIKKFLAKKEEEERLKTLEARRKAEELMAKRDVKAKKKIEKMLKVIKSANKSVLEDATDAQANAFSLAESEQPDEDDYGYTSNVASQFYQRLMDKYKSNPQEPRFKEAERRTMTKEDLARTRARVKDAIMRQVEEEKCPRTRKSRINSDVVCEASDYPNPGGKYVRGPDPYNPIEDPNRRNVDSGVDLKSEEKKKNHLRKANVAPPPPDFATLLKLAEQKQKEPLRIDNEIKLEKRKQEPERLMTKREKKEHDERVAYLEMKRLRDRVKDDPKLSDKEKQLRLAKLEAMRAAGKLPNIPPSNGNSGMKAIVPSPLLSTKVIQNSNGLASNEKCSSLSSIRCATVNARPANNNTKQTYIRMMGKIKKRSETETELSSKNNTDLAVLAAGAIMLSSKVPKATSQNVKERQQQSASIKQSTSKSSKEKMSVTTSSVTPNKSSLTSNYKAIQNQSTSPNQHLKAPQSSSNSSSKTCSSGPSATISTNTRTSTQSKLIIPFRLSSTNSSSIVVAKTNSVGLVKNEKKTKRLMDQTAISASSGNASTRHPLENTIAHTRLFPSADVQRTIKRPMMRQSSQQRPQFSIQKKRRVIDSDSEYDSEMDDFIDDGDCEEDYSSAIKEIFGYDKSRYRNECYDDDDYNMESSYAQQMREEYISKKIGIMEDLEDMRMEEEEKRRKLGKKGTMTTK